MNFQLQHPKFKPKLLIFLLAVLIMIQTITIHYQPPLEVCAAGGTMTDGSVNPTRGNVPGGAKYDRTGWLFWLADEDGGNRSTVMCAICNSAGIIDRNGNPLPAENIHLQNRFGDLPVMLAYKVPSFGTPFTEGGDGRGTEVKEYLLQDNNGNKRAYKLISNFWGEEEALKWNQRERVLVFECVYWNMVYENGVGTGIWQCGTANWWGEYQHANGINADDVGDTWINKYTNNLYAHCVQFEPGIPSIGITAGSQAGLVTNSEMANKSLGYGIGVVWNDNNSIRTYDPSQGSPGKPEPREGKEGLCNIVKGYYKESANGSKESLGVYSEQLVTNNIIVCEEPEFELVSWDVSTTTKTSLDPTNWNPPATISRSGTTTESLTLTTPETCVYVLLKQTELEESPEPMDYNYKLTQTQITRRVFFSKADNENQMKNIYDHEFRFSNPSHQTECTGHSCDGCEDVECNCSLTDGQTCSTNHGKTCPGTHTCTWGNWKDQSLTLSIYNTKKNDYPNILATKTNWNYETYRNCLSKSKRSYARNSVSYSYYSTYWDYVCILMRGSDKLTLAQWVNNGAGVPTSTSANTDLVDASSSGFKVSNTKQGTRKTIDSTIKSSNISLYHTIKVLFFCKKLIPHP